MKNVCVLFHRFSVVGGMSGEILCMQGSAWRAKCVSVLLSSCTVFSSGGVRAFLCMVQHGRQGTSVCCCDAALLLVAMMARSCMHKVRHGMKGTYVQWCIVALLLLVMVARAFL